MGYIKASDIRIFPSSSRTVSNQQGTNWLTEHNLANISEQFFTNKDGFVIEPLDGVTVESGTEVKFNIAGYYFKTTAGAIAAALNDSNSADTETTSFITFEDSGNSITAKITTLLVANLRGEADVSYEYLKGKDSGNTAGTEVEGAVESTYTLVLFTGTKSNVAGWKVPRSSRINLPNTRLDNSTLSNGATIILGEGSNSTITGTANGGTLSNVVINGNNTSIDIGGTIAANGSISTNTNLTVNGTTSLHRDLTVAAGSGAAAPNITLNANAISITGSNTVSITGGNNSSLNFGNNSSLALGDNGSYLSVNSSEITSNVPVTIKNTLSIPSSGTGDVFITVYNDALKVVGKGQDQVNITSTGKITHTGEVEIKGEGNPFTVNSSSVNITSASNITLNGVLTVVKPATFNNAVTLGNTLSVSGLTTLSTANISTANISTSLNVLGNTTLGTSASNTVAVKGKTTFSADVELGSQVLINGSLSGTNISGAVVSANENDSKNLALAFKIDDGVLS